MHVTVDTPNGHISNRVVALCVGIVLAGATLLSNRTPFEAPVGAEASIDRWIAVPIALSEPNDIRDYVLPAGVVLLAVAALLRRAQNRFGWFHCVGLAVIVIAVISAGRRGTMELSTGWIWRFAAGFLWASLLGKCLSTSGLRMVERVAGGVAIAACIGFLLCRYAMQTPYPELPIGPVTLSAGLAGLWAAMSIASMVAARDLNPGSVAALVLSITVLVACQRRGAWLGLFAAIGVVAAVLVWGRGAVSSSRIGRIAGKIVLPAVFVVFAAAGLWFAQWMRQAQTSSASMRLLYVTEMSRIGRDTPLFGVGPDVFICEMTSALALRRAEAPARIGAWIDSAAHNEWFQGVFELGFVGGLLYVAMPVIIVLLALRSWRRTDDPGVCRAALWSAAGLVFVLVAEASSINMRYSTLPAWYWTLIGTALAASRPANRGVSRNWATAAGRIVLAAAAAAIGIAFTGDARCARAHAAARSELESGRPEVVPLLKKATGRFGAERWIETHLELGMAQREAGYRESIDTLREVVGRCAGYPDACFQLALAEASLGDVAGARRTLDYFFDRVNPYEPQANLLYMDLPGTSAEQRLTCLRRGLREADADEAIRRQIDAALFEAVGLARWQERVVGAIRDVSKSPPNQWRDPLAPEALRIETIRLEQQGKIADAVEPANLAAAAYMRLADEAWPQERQAPAEADACFRAAEISFRADPLQYTGALSLIERAEQYLVHGVDGAYRPPQGEGNDYLAGPGLPTTYPTRFAELWRHSAKLHMLAGKWELLDLRIAFSLSEDARDEKSIRAAKTQLARELMANFSSVPADRRPPAYPAIVDLASG